MGRGQPWTEEEINFLRRNFKEMTDEELAAEMDRTKTAVTRKRDEEDLMKQTRSSFSKWEEHEVEFLRDNYGAMTNAEMADELGRSTGSVQGKLQTENLNREKHKAWTDEELAFLRRNFDSMTDAEIADELDREVPGVKDKRLNEGLRKTDVFQWSDEDTRFLRQNWREMTDEEIAEQLGCEVHSVQTKRRREDLVSDTKDFWSEEELNFLRQNYERLKDREIADELGRSRESVKSKRQYENLECSREWSDEELDTIEDNWEDMSDSELAEQLGRGRYGVSQQRRRLGLYYENFIDSDGHDKWEKLCEDIARHLYGGIQRQKRFHGGSLIPDIFIPSEAIVVDAKLSVYDGSIDDVEKYLQIERVESVELWSYRPFKQGRKGVTIRGRDELKRLVEIQQLQSRIENMKTGTGSRTVQTSLG
nr:MAG: hypothetical protein J07AB56_08720 [Candidatus Nanosalinarum sp. J07AB56]